MAKRTVRETREFLLLQLITRMLIVAAFAMAIYMGIVFFTGSETNYFLKHFGPGLTIILVGVVAILLPTLNKMSVSTSDKGDNLMYLVGAILIILGIGTVVFTFL